MRQKKGDSGLVSINDVQAGRAASCSCRWLEQHGLQVRDSRMIANLSFSPFSLLAAMLWRKPARRKVLRKDRSESSEALCVKEICRMVKRSAAILFTWLEAPRIGRDKLRGWSWNEVENKRSNSLKYLRKNKINFRSKVFGKKIIHKIKFKLKTNQDKIIVNDFFHSYIYCTQII